MLPLRRLRLIYSFVGFGFCSSLLCGGDGGGRVGGMSYIGMLPKRTGSGTPHSHACNAKDGTSLFRCVHPPPPRTVLHPPRTLKVPWGALSGIKQPFILLQPGVCRTPALEILPPAPPLHALQPGWSLVSTAPKKNAHPPETAHPKALSTSHFTPKSEVRQAAPAAAASVEERAPGEGQIRLRGAAAS